MEVIPEYKQTEVGVIPKDWGWGLLGNFLAQRPSYGINAPAVPFSAQLPVYIRITDITEDGRYRPSERVSVSSEMSSRYYLEEGDIVFARTGASVGKSYRYNPQDGPLVFAGFLIRVRPDAAKLLPSFVSAYATTGSYWRWVDLMSMRSGQPGINGNEYAQLPIPIPALSEQRLISEALSDIDALLHSLESLIAKKRDLKQAALQQLLTGQTRLPGFSGEWAKTKISQMCEYVDGVRTFGGDIGYLEIGDIDVELKSYSISSKEKLSVAGAVKVPFRTLLISTVRPTRGAIAITQSSLHVSSAFCRLKPVNDFLYHVVCQSVFLRHLGENAIGGTYPTCRDETILDYETLMPRDKSEQVAIASILSDMDAELASLEARREKTRDLKQAMMQELLTGRTRLV
jgi:type I restriction enzyme S subunit